MTNPTPSYEGLIDLAGSLEAKREAMTALAYSGDAPAAMSAMREIAAFFDDHWDDILFALRARTATGEQP